MRGFSSRYLSATRPVHIVIVHRPFNLTFLATSALPDHCQSTSHHETHHSTAKYSKYTGCYFMFLWTREGGEKESGQTAKEGRREERREGEEEREKKRGERERGREMGREVEGEQREGGDEEREKRLLDKFLVYFLCKLTGECTYCFSLYLKSCLFARLDYVSLTY